MFFPELAAAARLSLPGPRASALTAPTLHLPPRPTKAQLRLSPGRSGPLLVGSQTRTTDCGCGSYVISLFPISHIRWTPAYTFPIRTRTRTSYGTDAGRIRRLSCGHFACERYGVLAPLGIQTLS